MESVGPSFQFVAQMSRWTVNPSLKSGKSRVVAKNITKMDGETRNPVWMWFVFIGGRKEARQKPIFSKQWWKEIDFAIKLSLDRFVQNIQLPTLSKHLPKRTHGTWKNDGIIPSSLHLQVSLLWFFFGKVSPSDVFKLSIPNRIHGTFVYLPTFKIYLSHSCR